MDLVVGLIVFGILYAVYKININYKVDNYDISKVDTTKITEDRAKGVSQAEVCRRMTTGRYDKK